MKKLLGIVVLGLLWCNASFAKTCDWSWSVRTDIAGAIFTIENKSEYIAKITGATIYSEDNKKMYQYDRLIYVKPFNKKSFKVLNSSLMWDLAKSAALACSSITIGMYEIETKRKDKSKSKSSEKTKNKGLVEKIFGE